MFAYNSWENGTGPTLATTPMLLYPFEVRAIPDHKNPDESEWGVWVEVGDNSAVLIVGRKSLGPEGYVLPQAGDCSQHQGYHGDPYQPQILFYDPADLAAVAQGQINAWDVAPYVRTALDKDLIETCEWFLKGATFDPENRFLYLLQSNADTVSNEFEPYPVINVYKVLSETTQPAKYFLFITYLSKIIK